MFIFPICFFQKKPAIAPTPKPTEKPTEGFDEFDYILFSQHWDSQDIDPLTIDKLMGYPKITVATPSTSSVDYFEAILFEDDFISADLDPLVLEEYMLDVSTLLSQDSLEKLLFDSYGIDDNFGTLD